MAVARLRRAWEPRHGAVNPRSAALTRAAFGGHERRSRHDDETGAPPPQPPTPVVLPPPMGATSAAWLCRGALCRVASPRALMREPRCGHEKGHALGAWPHRAGHSHATRRHKKGPPCSGEGIVSERLARSEGQWQVMPPPVPLATGDLRLRWVSINPDVVLSCWC